MWSLDKDNIGDKKEHYKANKEDKLMECAKGNERLYKSVV
jgi:hypothetical protein